MTIPRSVQINPAATPYYHCVSRCVRRAFLCGRDAVTGFNFDHRRAWIEQRLQELAGIFAIDLCAYAVMSNHYHVVLHLNTDQLRRWDDGEIISRWKLLHRLPAGFEAADDRTVARQVAVWRERLGSISWFMKSVNEPLARLANKEDGCKGRFWEGRFGSQALLDDAALVKSMAHVDLNPVRARIADSPEASEHTSVKARIEHRDGALAPMAGRRGAQFCVPIGHVDYLQLVDATGRALRHGKRGQIDPALEPVLERLAARHPCEWLSDLANLSRRYCRAIGSPTSLRAYRELLGQQRLNGVTG